MMRQVSCRIDTGLPVFYLHIRRTLTSDIKTAVITGSTSGIGLTIAKGLAGSGMNIVMNGIETPEQVETERAELMGLVSTPVFEGVSTPVFEGVSTPVFEGVSTPVFEGVAGDGICFALDPRRQVIE